MTWQTTNKLRSSQSSSLYGFRIQYSSDMGELGWSHSDLAQSEGTFIASTLNAPLQIVGCKKDNHQIPLETSLAVSSANHVRLVISDLVQFDILEGNRIEASYSNSDALAIINLYLLGSAMGCILHQRGVIPLHMSTVYINGQAWGFTAPSGTGKSTLAARLHRFAGCPMVSDDVAALYFIDGQPHVAGGPPLLKLQPEFAALFPDAHIEPIPHPESNKLRVQVKNSFIPGLVPLAGIIVLERDETVAQGGLEIGPLTGTQAFLGAREAIYRYQMGLAMSSQAHMFSKLTELTTHVPFYRGRLGNWTVADGGSTEAAIVERIAHLRK